MRAGQKVLVLGASGGVGHLAAQIATALGAEVTGVCRTDKLELVRSLRLTRVVDHTEEDALDGRTAYDVIIDTGGHRRLRDLRRGLTARGRLVIVGSGQPPEMGSFISNEDTADLRALTELIEAGSVTPHLDSVRPLARAQQLWTTSPQEPSAARSC